MADKVNHPSHYGGDTVYETIKVMEAKLSHDEFVGAMKFQISKYMDRSGKKTDDVLEDWDKADFYLDYLRDYERRHRANWTGERRVQMVQSSGSPVRSKVKRG